MTSSQPDGPLPPRRRGWRLGLALTWLGLAYVLAVALLRHGVSERHLLAYLLVNAPSPALVAPPAVWVLLLLMLRRWRLAAANVMVGVLAVALLMPPVLPHRPPPHEPARRIRVVTWNLHCDTDQLPQTQATLARLQPDIVCLQEAEPPMFARALPGAQAVHTHEGRLLTRGRIVRQRAFPLSAPGTSRWGLSTEIELPQGRLSVLNVHYVVGVKRHIIDTRAGRRDTIEETRVLENSRVLDWLRQTPGPRLVCGDFNTPPGARLYRLLRAEALDAFAAAGLGWGFTFPRALPLLRIDYVWCAGGAAPLRVRAMDGGMSDHQLVVADVVVP